MPQTPVERPSRHLGPHRPTAIDSLMMTSIRQKARLGIRDLKERILFDFAPARAVLAFGSLAVGMAALLAGRQRQGAEILARTHRAGLNKTVDRIVERSFRSALHQGPGRIAAALRNALLTYPASVEPTPPTAQFHEFPERLLGGCMIVLKSPTENERGVLYLYYSYVYPLFLKYFDVESILSKYRIVIEPSWSGHCDLNILCLHRLGQQIFVGALEPRDATFLRSMQSSFSPVHFGGNTWVDTDVFKPLPDTIKDIDIVCISSWAWYKRHWAIFRALRKLRKRGIDLKTALIGYKIDMNMEDIRAQARLFGVEDLIQMHERLTASEVNGMLNRSKVNLLWSRREGTPRAIIEGMAAGIPCIIRTGFNYGYHYPHINEKTGAFSTENELPAVLLRVIRDHASYAPRERAVAEMTPEASTARLNAAIKAAALEAGEVWTRDLAVKVSTLDQLDYKNPADHMRFEGDYRFLESKITGRARA